MGLVAAHSQPGDHSADRRSCKRNGNQCTKSCANTIID
jgi:hypothetical protein